MRFDAASPAIFVELHDERSKFIGVWLHPGDVWREGGPLVELVFGLVVEH